MVSKYAAQADLGEALTAGGDAYVAGDREGAERDWGRAAALATAAGDDETLSRLAGVVEIVDAEKGVVRLRADATRSHALHVVIPSRVSEIAPRQEDQPMPEPADAPPIACTGCPALSPAGANFCVGCGRPFGEAVS